MRQLPWHSDPLAMLIGVTLAALICVPPAHADDGAAWSTLDKTLLATYVTASGYDAAQTSQCLHVGRCVETNPLLGSHPSDARVVGTKLVVGAGLYMLADHFPQQRTLLLGIGNVIEIGTVAHNVSIGMRVKF